MAIARRAIYIATFALMLLDGFVHHEAIEWALAVAFACYLFVELPQLEQAFLWAVVGLCAAGGLMFAFVPPPADLVHSLVRNASNFLLVFIAVGFLQAAAESSQNARKAALSMGTIAGTNSLVSNILWHTITAITNFSGVALLSQMYGQQTDPGRRRLLALGVSRACSLAALWSPFFVCLSIVLTVVPGLTWTDVALPGLGLAVLLVTLNAVLAAVTSGGAVKLFTWPIRASDPWSLFRMLAIVLALMASFVAVWRATGAAVPVVLGATMPVFAVVWTLWETRRLPSIATATEIESGLGQGIQRYRKEVFIFFGASVLGAGMAAIAGAHVDAGALFADVPNVLLHGGLIAGLFAMTTVGLHPQVVIIVTGPTLVAAGLDIPPVGLALILLMLCGLGPLVTPFSALSMFTAKALDTSPWRVAWRWNGPFVALAAAIGGTFILVFETLKGL